MQAAPFLGFRDRRIDLLRGSALFMIFVDHVPGNTLSRLMLINHALSDAAEIFVLLAGYSAWLSYGAVFERSGAWAGFRRVLARCWHLYTTQALLLALSVMIASVWCHAAGLEPGPFLQTGAMGLIKALVLYAQPPFYNILPLYICLLAVFPIVWFGFRRLPRTTLLASAGLWLWVNINPGINLPEWVNQAGWTFNPFAWQLLFVLGAVVAATRGSWRHSVQRRTWIAALCLTFLAVAWVVMRYLALTEDWVLIHRITGPWKEVLHPVRLLSGIAVAYLVLTSRLFCKLVTSGCLHAVEVCGRHSLAVFGVGSLLSLAGRLTFRTVGHGLLPQIAVNGIGVFTLLAVAHMLDQRRNKLRNRLEIRAATMKGQEENRRLKPGSSGMVQSRSA